MENLQIEKNIEKAKEALNLAEAVLITAGAGMGVDSGLPDFRGKEGFWRAYPYAKKLGLSFQELANPKWFKADPYLAWAFYGHRLNLYRNTQPHKGFYLLRDFVRKKGDNYFIFTSNVDGQFQKACFDQNKIVEIHGSIHYLQCIKPCSNDIWSADSIDIEVDMENFRAKDPLPKCVNCGDIARPNILMFGDWSWISDRTESQEFRLNLWLNRNEDKNIVIIEIGAGEAIPTVRWFGERIAKEYNGTLIRINPRDYTVPSNIKAIPIALGGLEAIKKLLE
ncbi:MAG: NAD-dependent deacetylase [Hydrogenothermaceae bacterium]|nr:NAD-dependent deacetylase [Hydrogenothermaceae bacterium]